MKLSTSSEDDDLKTIRVNGRKLKGEKFKKYSKIFKKNEATLKKLEIEMKNVMEEMENRTQKMLRESEFEQGAALNLDIPLNQDSQLYSELESNLETPHFYIETDRQVDLSVTTPLELPLNTFRKLKKDDLKNSRE